MVIAKANIPGKGIGWLIGTRLRDLAGSNGSDNFFDVQASWIEEALRAENHQRGTRWTESVAAGSRPFVETIRMKLGHLVRGRKEREPSAGWELREAISPYNTDFPSQNSGLRPENQYLWNETVAFPRG